MASLKNGLFVLVVLLTACSKPETLVREQQYFDQQVAGNANIERVTIAQAGFTLKYARSGNRQAPAIIYIHGTPGGWDNGARYLMDADLQAQAYLMSVDRPGWGGSQWHGEKPEIGFASQAERLRTLLVQVKRENGGRPIILLGHSLGASLSPYMAMEYPELVDGLVLLAGSLSPELGKPRWYNLAASMGVVSWFLSAEMRHANREIMPLQRQLEDMKDRWLEIGVPVTVIQGEKDKLVFPQNADFAEQVLGHTDLKVVRIPGAGHFLPWENRALVKSELLWMLDKLAE